MSGVGYVWGGGHHLTEILALVEEGHSGGRRLHLVHLPVWRGKGRV